VEAGKAGAKWLKLHTRGRFVLARGGKLTETEGARADGRSAHHAALSCHVREGDPSPLS
jgi:hypothetical protein